jgi:hypothetical protein
MSISIFRFNYDDFPIYVPSKIGLLFEYVYPCTGTRSVIQVRISIKGNLYMYQRKLDGLSSRQNCYGCFTKSKVQVGCEVWKETYKKLKELIPDIETKYKGTW